MSLVTPHQLDLYSAQMGHLYNGLEGEILRSIMNRLQEGSVQNVESWQMEKLQQLRMFNNEVVKLLSATSGYAEEEIEKIFHDSVEGIIKDVDEGIPYNAPDPTPTQIDNVMRGYFNQAWGDIDNYVNQTLVSTNHGNGTAARAYQDVLNRTSALFNTGIFTQEQALERSINELAEKGIQSTFIDKGGHRWSMERYVQTVMRSTLNNTYNEVKTERMGEFGVHTVTVTSHMGARDACLHIQGQVVDLRPLGEVPEDAEYKSIYDPSWGADYKQAHGHRGVNCTHQHIPFIPGVNENHQPTYDEAENKKVAENRSVQRQIERNIVKYKKRLMVAEGLQTENVGRWQEMIDKWDRRMEEHLKYNGDYLNRELYRERVYTPLETLLTEPELYL